MKGMLRMKPRNSVGGCPGQRPRRAGFPVVLIRVVVFVVPMMMIILSHSAATAFVVAPTTRIYFGRRVSLQHQPLRQYDVLLQQSTMNHPSWKKHEGTRVNHRPFFLGMAKSDVTQEKDKVLSSPEMPQETALTSSTTTQTTSPPFEFTPLFFDKKKKTAGDPRTYNNIDTAKATSSSVDRVNDSVKTFDDDDDDSATSSLFPSSTSGILSFLLNPIAQALQSATNGWALSYADLFPETENTIGGRIFLATNLAYVLAGVGLWVGYSVVSPEAMTTTTATTTWPLTVGLEVASVCSFVYHYEQLKNDQPSLVRLALMVDYIAAVIAILIGSGYFLQDVVLMMNAVDLSSSSLLDDYTTWLQMAIASGLVSGACLSVSWVWERGWPYLLFHSLWHLASAYTGYTVGMLHAAAMAVISSGDSGDGTTMDGLTKLLASNEVLNTDLVSIVTSMITTVTSGGNR